MGYFSRLAGEIEEALCEGMPIADIAEKFNISEEQVQAYIAEMESAHRDAVSMNTFGTPVWPSNDYGMN